MAKKFAFEYTICSQADDELFQKQCTAFERKFPDMVKERVLEDVDGSKFQTYHHTNGKIVVSNDYAIGCLYVDSEFDLLPYFKEEQ